MLSERARGDTYKDIGDRHGYSDEGARKLLVRESRKYLDGLELTLAVAWKHEQAGRWAEWPTYVVPHGPDWTTSMALLTWTVERLKARDLDVRVQTRPTPAGSVFQLSL